MNNRTVNENGKENICLYSDVPPLSAEKTGRETESETFDNNGLTEESAKSMIESDDGFNQRLVLPSEWNTNIKPCNLVEIPLIGNESDDDLLKRRTEEIYRSSPMTELLVHLKILELQLKPVDSQSAGSSNRCFLESREITESGRETGVENGADQEFFTIPIAHRKVLKVTEIDIQEEDFASARFDWWWEPNMIWYALDWRSPKHQGLPAPLRERMEREGLTDLIPVRLTRIGKGISDFGNTGYQWKLIDTTFD